MSTRSTTHFIYGDQKHPTAIIYRHPDGYPDGAGVDLLRFLDECGKLKDPRFSDPSYLAAKYVVFLADMFNHSYREVNGRFETVHNESKLDFLSVGVVNSDPGDIEYRYVVDCKGASRGTRPTVKCYAFSNQWDEVEIPKVAA